ncbi:MAG: hypothetical protein KGH91_04720, partial [Rhodospirillales bacterium]|nr:hypothetical protein [Rhodospirillales bacterium]
RSWPAWPSPSVVYHPKLADQYFALAYARVVLPDSLYRSGGVMGSGGRAENDAFKRVEVFIASGSVSSRMTFTTFCAKYIL